MRRPALSKSFSTLGLGLIVGIFILACGQGVWPERESAIVDGIRVDSLKFFPSHARYILNDSLTSVLFKGYHLGYKCSEILEISLKAGATGQANFWGPKTRIRLPAQPDCPIESAGNDTLLTQIFKDETDSIIRLANSSGTITDSARLVKGRFSTDSLSGVPAGLARTITLGRWTFLDSTSQTPRRLFSDSLSSCEFLNLGTYRTKGDTVTVKISFVTLDSTSVADRCHGPSHQDEIILNFSAR